MASGTPRPFQSTPFTKPSHSGKRVRLQAPSSRDGSSKRSRHFNDSSDSRSQVTQSSEVTHGEIQPESQEPPKGLEEEDSLSEVIMAIDMRDRDTIGCSYYVARVEKLYMLSDVRFGGLDIIDTRAIDESVDEHLDPERNNRNGGNIDSQFRLPYILDIRPSNEFSYEGGLRKLVDLQTENSQENRTSFVVPGDEDPHESYRYDTLISLQILQEDYHPHSHNQGPTNTSSGSKEGLSVYGLFHHLARTPQGKFCLRQYFLRPSLDLDTLKQRHDTVSILLQASNEALLGDIVKSLKSIKNMKHVVTNLRKGISGGSSQNRGVASGVWFTLRSFAFYTINIRQAIAELQHGQHLDICNKVLEKFEVHHLGTVGKMITDIVDFTESQETHRTVVLPGVDETLDGMKRQYNGLEDMLNHLSREIGHGIPKNYALNLNVIFFPQIGFLISMPINPITETVDYRGVEGEEWREVFHTADRVYFKDFRMEELDGTVGDIYADVCG
ncbi:MAG: hypothetical protein LQ340_007241 [Diploschistes diacapsis]|nr:MAG: hypothetical protein LQ340_007241 [Diploschistes diacapsis]